MADVDVDRFRSLVRAEAAKLRRLPANDPNVDRITTGRESGLHLALSFLRECIEE